MIRTVHFARRVLLLVAFLFCLAPLTSAQYGSSIEGTVTDKSGAVLPGATVTATNQATGVSRSTVTGDSGFYRIPGLPPGTYTVGADAASFKKKSTPNVVISAEAVRGLDVVLEPASAQETVTVTAGTQDLQTEGASVTDTITAREVVELPQFGRDPYELLRLTPGVFADSARQGNGNSLAFFRRKTSHKP